VQPTADGVRIEFTPGEEILDELRRLAELEAECCAFARWLVREDDGVIVLDVRSEGEGAAAVRAMFSVAGE
jgi:hypothetical protein